MANELENNSIPVFEQIKRIDDAGDEFWSARDLSKVLEYSEYRHFKPVIDKAKEACKNSGQNVKDHFEDFLEMVNIGSGGYSLFIPVNNPQRRNEQDEQKAFE